VFGIGPPELLVILILALIVFGPKKLPEIGRTVGKGLREFRRAQQEIQGEIDGVLRDDEPGSATTSRRPSGPPAASGGDQDRGERPVTGET
jgi:sec-independent protein translocase protein TatA